MQLRGDRNQCQGCKSYFNSTTAFEKHRVGEFGVDRRCLSADEMQAKGMKVNADGFWISKPMGTDAVSRLPVSAN